MTEFLLSKFVKNYKDIEDFKVRENYGTFAGLIGILSNILLFGTKILIGLASGSLAITIDAVNNLMDSASSIITLIGFKISGKPADKDHPFGHARSEYISALFISQIILFVGIQFLSSSVGKILNPESTNMTLPLFFVLVLSLLVKLWQGNFNKKLAKVIDSTVLIATAKDSFNDIFITAGILIGFIIEYLTGLKIDGYIGALIAVYIMISGFDMIKGVISELVGMAPSDELIEAIGEKIRSYDGVYGFHDLIVHDYGPNRLMASVHVEVPADQDILVSHEIIDNIENAFKTDMNMDFVIHMDPVQTDEETVRIGAKIADLVSEFNPQFSIHDFRMVWGKEKNSIIFDLAVSFQTNLKETDEYIKDKLKAKIHAVYPKDNIVIKIDHNYLGG